VSGILRRERSAAVSAVVSVVVPIFNGEAFLGAQLNALAGQDFDEPWEVVLADNGSTDRSLEIAAGFRDRLDLRVVDASAVRGVSYARSLGARSAAAPLVAYCDADDVVGAQWLTALYDAWAPGVVVAGALEHDLLNRRQQIEARGRLQAHGLALHMGFLPIAAACNLLMEKGVLEQIGGWRLDLPHGEDAELSWRLQLAGHSLVFAPDAVVHYRMRGNSRDTFRQIYWYNEPYPKLFKEFRQSGAKRRRAREVAGRYVWVLTRLPYLLLDERRRNAWCVVAAENAGRLAGSVHYRSLFL
jgi:glycosyltransferase involved in cell wall biosynthesis